MKWDSLKTSSSHFFMEVQRMHARERINLKIVSPYMLEEFIGFVVEHKNIPPKYKLIICLELCSGSRVSEILDLKKKDVLFKGDAVAIKIGVKKKRREKEKMLYRMGAVPPKVASLLKTWILPMKEDEILFKIHRSNVYDMYQKMFGICPHSLRHSFIVYCFDVKNMKLQEITNKMLFANSENCLRYYNSRIDRDAWDLFENVA